MFEIIGVDESSLLLVHSSSLHPFPLLNLELCIGLSQDQLPKQTILHCRRSIHDHILAHFNDE